MIKIYISFSLILFLACGSSQKRSSSVHLSDEEIFSVPNEKIYALVDRVAINTRSRAITETEVNKRLEMVKKSKNLSASALVAERNKIIDKIIDEAILEQIAEEETIIVSEEKVKNEIEKIMERAKAKDLDSFKKLIEAREKVPFEFWKEQLRIQILAELVMSIAVDFAPPSKNDVQDWYNKNKNTPAMTQVNVKHILIIPRSSSFADEKAANTQLEDIRNQILSGASFEVLAARHSKDPGSAVKGGSIGWVFLGSLDPYFANQAYQMRKPGEISPVFKSSFGYHIIKYLGRRTAPLEEIEDNISNMISMQSREEQFKKWIKQRRATSSIYIFLNDYKETL
ncbi:MAG: peptidylprolyl isomerase [Spirochaetes bacterium]|nr:peptidylprolyl isomerase [Spirochaetota bacterium]